MGFLPTHPGKRLFLSWVKYCAWSSAYARGIGAEMHFCDQGASLGVFKYIPRTIASLWLMVVHRPETVFCMNPPYFVGLCAYLYTLFFRARFVLDSHSAAFDCPKWTPMMPLHAFLLQQAAFSTVTNGEWKRRVEEMGGIAVELRDVPSQLHDGDYPVPPDRFNIAFSCVYAPDEPVLNVFDAVRGLPEVRVYVTGNDKKAPQHLLAAKPENVILTGFLSNEEYGSLLCGVDVIMALTTRDFTMQCAGSEAVSAGKPFITSNWPVLRETFSRGTVHVDNSAADIRRAILEVRERRDELAREMDELQLQRVQIWEKTRATMEELLSKSRIRS